MYRCTSWLRVNQPVRMNDTSGEGLRSTRALPRLRRASILDEAGVDRRMTDLGGLLRATCILLRGGARWCHGGAASVGRPGLSPLFDAHQSPGRSRLLPQAVSAPQCVLGRREAPRVALRLHCSAHDRARPGRPGDYRECRQTGTRSTSLLGFGFPPAPSKSQQARPARPPWAAAQLFHTCAPCNKCSDIFRRRIHGGDSRAALADAAAAARTRLQRRRVIPRAVPWPTPNAYGRRSCRSYQVSLSGGSKLPSPASAARRSMIGMIRSSMKV
jgi:hypothetical protein